MRTHYIFIRNLIIDNIARHERVTCCTDREHINVTIIKDCAEIPIGLSGTALSIPWSRVYDPNSLTSVPDDNVWDWLALHVLPREMMQSSSRDHLPPSAAVDFANIKPWLKLIKRGFYSPI